MTTERMHKISVACGRHKDCLVGGELAKEMAKWATSLPSAQKLILHHYDKSIEDVALISYGGKEFIANPAYPEGVYAKIDIE